MSDNVISLRPRLEPVRARVEIGDADGGEFIVGINYQNGGYILCGCFSTFREASEVAIKRAASLGNIPIVDFSNAGPPDGGKAA